MPSGSLHGVYCTLFSNVYDLYSLASSKRMYKDLNLRGIYPKREIPMSTLFYHTICHSVGSHGVWSLRTALKTLNSLTCLNASACNKYVQSFLHSAFKNRILVYTRNGASNKHDIWKLLSLVSYASPLESRLSFKKLSASKNKSFIMSSKILKHI